MYTNSIKAEYSIVSRGSEKYINHGYMAITNIIGGNRYIVNQDHNQKISNVSGSLIADQKYSVFNIAFSRFELISSLALKLNTIKKKDKIIIVGLGSVGVCCLFFLLDHQFYNIEIIVKENRSYYNNLINIIKEKYGILLKFITNYNPLKSGNIIIDTTGSSNAIKSIIDMAKYMTKIYLLGTPRESKFLIDPLIIHRKNLTIYGGHEFNGIDNRERNKKFEDLLNINENKNYLKKLIEIYKYDEKTLEQIKTKKKNFIEMFIY